MCETVAPLTDFKLCSSPSPFWFLSHAPESLLVLWPGEAVRTTGGDGFGPRLGLLPPSLASCGLLLYVPRHPIRPHLPWHCLWLFYLSDPGLWSVSLAAYLKPQTAFTDFFSPAFPRLLKNKKPRQRRNQICPPVLQKLKKVCMPLPHLGNSESTQDSLVNWELKCAEKESGSRWTWRQE